MGQANSSDEPPAHSTIETWNGLALKFTDKLISAVFNEKSPLFVFGILVVLIVSHIGYVYLLPPEDRVQAGAPAPATYDAVRGLAARNGMLLLGWILFVVCTLLSVIINGVLWNRIQRQGKELQQLRNDRIEGRVSSRDVSTIEEYEDRMKERFGANDDTNDH